MIDDRPPPSNAQAEASLIGAAVVYARDGEAVCMAPDALRAEDFYDPQHQIIWAELVRRVADGEVIDLQAVVEGLRRADAAAAIEKLLQCMQAVDSFHAPDALARHMQAWAELVMDCADRRRMLQLGQAVVEHVHHPGPDCRQMLLEMTQDAVTDLLRAQDERRHVSREDILRQATDGLLEPETKRGIPTGFAELDEKLGGLKPGGLYVVAARPSMGKTSLAVQMVTHVGVQERLSPLLITLEVAPVDAWEHLVQGHARVPTRTELSESEGRRVITSASLLAQTGIRVEQPQGNATLSQVAMMARMLRMRGQCDLLVVDYLQLMEMGGKTESRQTEVASLSRGLKGLARMLSIPVVALAQLNRNAEARADHRPRMGDLRESGAVEQDADGIVLLHRPEYYDTADRDLRGKAEIILAKNRHGPLGTIHMGWDGPTRSFMSWHDMDQLQAARDFADRRPRVPRVDPAAWVD